MPWSNQSGGGGGGPWRPSNNPGPWGSGPQGGGGNGGPPDLEELFRRSQDRIRNMMPGGSGDLGWRGFLILALLLLLGWLLTGLYTVRPNEVGINMVFGKFAGTTIPGLNYNWPYPIGSVVRLPVTAVNTMEVGVRAVPDAGRRTAQRVTADESLILTGDENIVDIDFNVQWQISPVHPENFIFGMQNPEASIKAVAESAMREVVGKRNIQAVLTSDRQQIEVEAKQLMQDTLDSYGAGVVIRLVQLLKADPPQQVIDAFRDVQAARQDQDRMKNEAETYASQVLPQARGEAVRMIQDAEAYRSRTVSEAKGASARFDQIYTEYKKAPDITRQRMFLETMERIYGGMDKVVIDQKANGSGVVPYLPLNELQRPARPATQPQAQGAAR